MPLRPPPPPTPPPPRESGDEWPSTVGLERPALDIFYRTERSWRRTACGLSIAGAMILIFARERYGATAVVVLVLSILCQLISWRAMRGAQRLEDKRITRLMAER